MTLSVGVVGASGRIARGRHLEGALVPLRAEGVVDRIVLAGREPETVRPLAGALGIDPADCVHVEDLLGDPAVDVVLVASPPDSHAELCTQALAAGKHVMVEKPVDLDPDVVRRLIGEAERASVNATMVMDKAFSPGFQALGRALERMDPATVLAVTGEFGYFVESGLDPSRPAQRPSWNYQVARGGSLSSDLYSHWSYMLEFVGRPVSVQAQQSIRIRERRDESGQVYAADVPDWLQVMGELDSGVPFSVRVSWGMRPATPFRMHVDALDCSFTAEVANLTRFEGTGPSVDEGSACDLESREDEFRAQWRHFLHGCASGSSDISGLEAGLRASEFVSAIDRSAATGTVCEVRAARCS